MNGILLVDKPVGMTSHDVVDRVRKAAQMRRVGHTGTLDPAATGLLILCLGRATRLSEFLTGLDKVYEGVLRLGVITDSYDLDGKILEERAVPDVSVEQAQDTFNRFIGDIMQVPPMVSAVKVNGERLYKRARKGEVIDRPARPVTVREFAALSCEKGDIGFRLCCTRGTYARSLCHDAGEILGCGGALASLRRTRVGKYSIEDAVALDALDGPEAVEERLLSMDTALLLPAIVVAEKGAAAVANGNAFGRDAMNEDCPVEEGWVQVKSVSGTLLALAQVESGPAGLRVRPRRVLCSVQ